MQVAPDVGGTELVFADYVDGEGPQISSVWTWLSHRAKIDFIQDPDPDSLLSAAGWLRFFPAQAPQAFMNNLFLIQANRAYLVNLDSDTAVTLTIVGKPVMPSSQWESDSFNLVGFHVDPSNLPTFSDFFSHAPAHLSQAIYRLENDAWKKINPLNTVIQPDVAYWVFSQGSSDFTGPLEVELPQINRLEYSTNLESLTAKLKNGLNAAQIVTLDIIGNTPGMFYPNQDLSAAKSWLPLPDSLEQLVPANGTIRLALGVRRADFTPDNFSETLEVISATGSRWLIPVTASAPKLNSLWVGTVTIDQVSQVQNYKHDCEIAPYIKTSSILVDGVPTEVQTAIPAQRYALCVNDNGLPIAADSGNALAPVAADFSFRVIMHREGSKIRLLKDVIQMRKANSDGTVGDYVLLTDDSLIANYSGVTLRDGESVGRRISTMAYDFGLDQQGVEITSMDMLAGGSFDSQVSFELELAADGATNPFRHKYHAQHGKPAYIVSRKMAFTFDVVEEGLGAGYDFKSGTYLEIVDGLHKLPVLAAGRFTLKHAAQIDTLNQ
ncbi:hypothetical protein ABKW31_17080 [Paraglaciecola sp. 25GB23A]